jgi:hypothetical protein
MDWADAAAAVVYASYGGQTGAEALFDVLDGTVGPAGRQPFTIERRRDDSPGATATKPVANGATYPLDYLHGDFFKDKV